MNVLHWHLIDSPAFPYKSKAYPQLAEKGAYSPAHQYDAKTINAIVQYAKERGVRVIPELEAPGHSTSWGYGKTAEIHITIVQTLTYASHSHRYPRNRFLRGPCSLLRLYSPASLWSIEHC
jgi:hypothetical protein